MGKRNEFKSVLLYDRKKLLSIHNGGGTSGGNNRAENATGSSETPLAITW